MSLKATIVGSSHAAALKAAQPGVLARFPDIDLGFFAAPGPLFRKLRFDPARKCIGALDPQEFSADELSLLRHLNGSDRIFLGRSDAVVLVGHDINETLNARILSRFGVDDTAHDRPDRSLSMSAYRALMAEIGQASLPDSGWWHWDNPRLFVSPAPRIAENCTEVGTRTVASWVPLVENNMNVRNAFALYPAMLAEMYRDKGITFVANPDETYGDIGLTKREYAEGAIYIRPGDHRANFDAKHMNARFGELCLDGILRTITAELALQG